MESQTQPNLIALLSALSQDERTIVTHLVERQYDLRAVASDFQLSIVDMLIWLAQPGIKVAMDTLRALAETALHLRSVEARRTSIDLLEHVALRATDDLEKRRAAIALTRATHLQKQRTAATRDQRTATVRERAGALESLHASIPPTRIPADARDSSLRPTSPATDPATSHNSDPANDFSAKPTADGNPGPRLDDHTPMSLIHTLATALAHNDNPEHDTGLMLLGTLAAPDLTLNGEKIALDDDSDFIQAISTSPLAPAIDAAAYSTPHLLNQSDTAATITLNITPHSHPPITCTFTLIPTTPTDPLPWRIKEIHTTSPNPPTTADP